MSWRLEMSENEPSIAGDKLRAANPPKFQDKNALLEQRKHGSKIFPIDCHHWDSANGASYNVWHWHPETEIVHAIEGKNLEVYFADRVYTFNAPAIVLIPGGVMHRIVVREKVGTWGFTYSRLTDAQYAYLVGLFAGKAQFSFTHTACPI